MIKGYLIERYTNMGGAYTTNRLLGEGKKAGVDLSVVGVEDTALKDGAVFHQGKILGTADFVINRYKYGVIKDCINGLAGYQCNFLEGLKRYINKANELSDLAGGSLCFPGYMLGRADSSYEEIVESVGTPFVAKGLTGSQGREVYLISRKEDFEKMKQGHRGEELLFQEFIRESFGRDVRFFMIEGEVTACMMRRAREGFRANFALGGSVETYPADERIREIGREIYRRTGLAVLGVDLLLGKEDYVFCELNVTPGIEGIEQACSVNVAGEIIAYVKNSLGKM